jgi:hypothetical protein
VAVVGKTEFALEVVVAVVVVAAVVELYALEVVVAVVIVAAMVELYALEVVVAVVVVAAIVVVKSSLDVEGSSLADFDTLRLWLKGG